jgi:hypothetical protein
VLTTLTTSGELLTVGTVIGGSGTSGLKPLLVRTAGPALTQFGVTHVLPDPQLSLIPGGASSALASNNNWGGGSLLANAFAQVGAFPYPASSSTDAAILQTNLSPGDFTVQVSDAGSGTGTVIAELYDATPAISYSLTTPRLINVAVLKNIGSGLTVGFVIGGDRPMKVLIRAVGPSLGAPPFNVPGTIDDPKIELFSGQTVIASNDNWGGGAELVAVFTKVGAFALGATSSDAALVMTLAPGNYTAEVKGANITTGVALVEIYEVP